MTSLPSAVTEGARRRMVLIDFDWQDADLLPRLLQAPGVDLRLVAGERTEDAGLRLAEVCGLQRTLDLADLTREIFDVALVSERSLRRARVQNLLHALRTPCITPGEFLAQSAAAAPAERQAPPAASAAPAGAAPPSMAPGLGPQARSHEPEPEPAAFAAPEREPMAEIAADTADAADAADAAPEDQGGVREAGGAPGAATGMTTGPGPARTKHATPEPELAEKAAPEFTRAKNSTPEPARAKNATPEPAHTENAAPEPARAESAASLPSEAVVNAALPSPPAAQAPPSQEPAPPPAAEDFESVMERALEGMAKAAISERPRIRRDDAGRAVQSLRDFPSKEDRAALESAIAQLVVNTGAVSAELHAGRATKIERIAQVGTHDPLLEGMVGLAFQLNQPQIVKGLSSPFEGKLWGAWPFRTIQHRGVLAASAIDPLGGVSPWEKMVEEMRERWDRQDREGAVQSFPLLPEQERTWLERADFRARLELAVERNKFDGLPFVLHRLEFPGPLEAVDKMCQGLPQLLRGSDYLCHLPPRHVLLLTAVPAEDYTHVRRRLLAAWEQAWREGGQTPPAPPITDLRAEIGGPEDAEGFLASAEAWLSPGS
jgi:hypothetical protein